MGDFSQTIVGSCGHPVRECWRVCCYVIDINPEPYGQYHFSTIALACRQAVQLTLWPLFIEEVAANDDNAKFRFH